MLNSFWRLNVNNSLLLLQRCTSYVLRLKTTTYWTSPQKWTLLMALSPPLSTSQRSHDYFDTITYTVWQFLQFTPTHPETWSGVLFSCGVVWCGGVAASARATRERCRCWVRECERACVRVPCPCLWVMTPLKLLAAVLLCSTLLFKGKTLSLVSFNIPIKCFWTHFTWSFHWWYSKASWCYIRW